MLCSIRRQEPKIDKLQEEQKRISKEITSFMALFQKGIPQLQCSECQEVVTQVTIVNHYKKHITELNGQIESLVATKEQNRKRKPDPRKEDISRKRLKEPGGGSLISKITLIRQVTSSVIEIILKIRTMRGRRCTSGCMVGKSTSTGFRTEARM